MRLSGRRVAWSMTLGLVAPGRTTRILVLLTLLDDCLVRAIALSLGCPSGRYFDKSARVLSDPRQRACFERSAPLLLSTRAIAEPARVSPAANNAGSSLGKRLCAEYDPVKDACGLT